MPNFRLLFLLIFSFTISNTGLTNNFDGNWAGTVTQQNPEEEFKMSLAIRPGGQGYVVGTWSLGNGCGGTLELMEKQLNNMLVRAYIDVDRDRQGRCLKNGRMSLELLDNDNLRFQMTYVKNPEIIVAGTLMRIGVVGSTPTLATDYTAQTLDVSRFDREAGSAQVFGIKMCATQIDSTGNCTTDISVFDKETVLINVSFNVMGKQMNQNIVAKWYLEKEADNYRYIGGKNIRLTTKNNDRLGNFFFTIGKDYPTGDYLLEVITDSGDLATKRFRIIR